jgi:3-carboxy-cis,cis-muconate cycloisomerase
LIVSERLSAELAPVLGRARARELLTELARRAYAEGRDLAGLLTESLAGQDALPPADLAALTDPARYTGSAPVLTDRALERR